MTSTRWAVVVAAGASALLVGAGVASTAPSGMPAGSGAKSAPSVITLDQANKKKEVTRTNLRIAAARNKLAYNKKRLVAKRGIIRITMTNPSNGRHNIAIRFENGREKKGRVARKGGTSRVQANLKRGRYTFFCSVPGQEKGGMRGTLIVR